MKRRVLFDCATLVTSGRLVDGIVRTSCELVRYAHKHRHDVVFSLKIGPDETRIIKPRWLPFIVENKFTIDQTHLPDRWATKRRLRHRMPYRIQEFIRWFQSPRLMLFRCLERIRLRGFCINTIERIQERIMSARLKNDLFTHSGERKAFVPYDLAVDTAIQYAANDVIVFSGSEWPDMVEALRRLQRVALPATVLLCYDIIPLIYPHLFPPRIANMFRECFDFLLSKVDLVIVTANCVEADVRRYCAQNKIALRATAVVWLGAKEQVPKIGKDQPVDALEAGKFVLFVSTIEPRKGHQLLFSTWKRLLTVGIPQATGFKLVFVGQKGWLVDHLVEEIQSHPSFGDTILWLSQVDDTLLHELYADCAFCVYPSIYEGFGLPVIEAFGHGKAVISSNGGALAEIAGGFSPCLDPLDEDSWYHHLSSWILDPTARQPYEQAIKNNFKPRSWDDVGDEFFSTIDRKIPLRSER